MGRVVVLLEKILKNAPMIAISILIVVTVVVFLSDQPTSATNRITSTQVTSDRATPTKSATPNDPANLQSASGPAANSTTNSTSSVNKTNRVTDELIAEKRLVDNSLEKTAGEESKSNSASAPILSDLLAGLEKKVAAAPTDLGIKMLLAQTYAEVGEVSRGLKMLREIKKIEPENQKISLVYATVLSKSSNPAELNEALELLNTLEKSNPAQKGSVLLQRGRVYLRMGETESAKKEWMQALAQLPEDSGYWKQVELELSRLN